MSEMIHKSAIRTVAAYETVDGQKFHNVVEAQEHTRFFLIDSIIASALKADPQVARLDPDLLRNFCRKYGAHLGNVMGEPFKPLPSEELVKLNPTITNTTRPGEAPRHGDKVEMHGTIYPSRPVSKAPELAMPYGSGKTDFGAHPLDPRPDNPLGEAMRRVDAKLAAEGKMAVIDTDGLSEDEIAAMLEKAMNDPAGLPVREKKAV